MKRTLGVSSRDARLDRCDHLVGLGAARQHRRRERMHGAEVAGVLAQALAQQALGTRPVALVAADLGQHDRGRGNVPQPTVGE